MIGPGMDALTSVLGGAAKGDMTEQASNDNSILKRAQVMQDQQKFALAAPLTRMKTGLMGGLANNFTPGSVSWDGPGSGLKGKIPTYSGGIGGSMQAALTNPELRTLMNQSMHDSLVAQMRGGADPNGSGQPGTDFTLPEDVMNVGKTSAGSKILGGAGLASGILGALLKMKSGPSTQSDINSANLWGG